MPRPLQILAKPWPAALMQTLALVQTLLRVALGRRRQRRRGARQRGRARPGVGLRVAWRVRSACTPRREWRGWSVSVRMPVSRLYKYVPCCSAFVCASLTPASPFTLFSGSSEVASAPKKALCATLALLICTTVIATLRLLEQCGWLLSGHVAADSVTAGGRVRRRRGFRSYITSTLALPEDAAAALALVGSSLAARPATVAGAG